MLSAKIRMARCRRELHCDVIKMLAQVSAFITTCLYSMGQVRQWPGNHNILDCWGYPFIITRLSMQTALKTEPQEYIHIVRKCQNDVTKRVYVSKALKSTLPDRNTKLASGK